MSLLNSLGMGIYSTVSWAMMGDAIDYNEWKNDSREEGTVYALHSFFRKLAQGRDRPWHWSSWWPSATWRPIRGNQAFEVALNMCYLVAAPLSGQRDPAVYRPGSDIQPG